MRLVILASLLLLFSSTLAQEASPSFAPASATAEPAFIETPLPSPSPRAFGSMTASVPAASESASRAPLSSVSGSRAPSTVCSFDCVEVFCSNNDDNEDIRRGCVASTTEFTEATRCEQCIALLPLNNFEVFRLSIVAMQNTDDFSDFPTLSNDIVDNLRIAVVDDDTRELALLLSESYEAIAVDNLALVNTASDDDDDGILISARTSCSALMRSAAYFATDASRTMTAETQRNMLNAIQSCMLVFNSTATLQRQDAEFILFALSGLASANQNYFNDDDDSARVLSNDVIATVHLLQADLNANVALGDELVIRTHDLAISVIFVNRASFSTAFASTISLAGRPNGVASVSIPGSVQQIDIGETFYMHLILWRFEAFPNWPENLNSSDVLTVELHRTDGSLIALNNLDIEPVVLVLPVRFQPRRGFTYQCQSWDFDARSWTSQGCSSTFSSQNLNVNCRCNHLTDFAALETPVRTPDDVGNEDNSVDDETEVFWAAIGFAAAMLLCCMLLLCCYCLLLLTQRYHVREGARPPRTGLGVVPSASPRASAVGGPVVGVAPYAAPQQTTTTTTTTREATYVQPGTATMQQPQAYPQQYTTSPVQQGATRTF